MTRDSNSRPSGRDVKQARGEARQSGGAAASPKRRANRPGDTIGEGEADLIERVASEAYKRGWDEGCETMIESNHDYGRVTRPHKDARGEGCGDYLNEVRDAVRARTASSTREGL